MMNNDRDEGNEGSGNERYDLRMLITNLPE